MQELWTAAGFVDVETRVIKVERSYDSFDDFWSTLGGSPSLKAATGNMATAQMDELKERVRKRLPVSADGRLTYGAWANAVKGRLAS
jgi:hypothetical protein